MIEFDYTQTVNGEFRFCGVANKAEVDAEYAIIQIIDAAAVHLR